MTLHPAAVKSTLLVCSFSLSHVHEVQIPTPVVADHSLNTERPHPLSMSEQNHLQRQPSVQPCNSPPNRTSRAALRGTKHKQKSAKLYRSWIGDRTEYQHLFCGDCATEELSEAYQDANIGCSAE
eukprot:CAMPEP_0116008308 /NCGR_PEP_ID=MMETSP0321-20121206/2792_1 /TAXON_ID=163516 /ORGANISM="Leptocylindrus danicus var. danicus, Strain B650" /LENGTH=124 /DNA_ID=CAMNT_0003477119 /DNA_START=15 /DNA_END=389 /DNA_ORIENTATION=+